MPTVRVIIVNFRTAPLVVDCLRSLQPEVKAFPNCCVTVVEGGSGDDSVTILRNAIQHENWGDWVELMPLAENRGFAAGNNVAIRPLLSSNSPPDYVLLLNPDTVVRSGAIRELVDFLQAHPKVGMAGSRLEDPDGTPQRSAFRFPGSASEFEHAVRLGLVSKFLKRVIVAPPVRNDAHQTDWVAGASLLIRWKVFESIGLLDEKYFLYYEETDFCARAARAGWPTWYVPQSRVVHLVGQSSGLTNSKQPPKRLPPYWFESRQRYFVQNHGWIYAKLTDCAWLTGLLLWKVRAFLQRKTDHGPKHLIRDCIRYNFVPSWFVRSTT